ncbi:hypothetical protein [Streptomyces sp. NPDC058142]|uniref:hypothetical protein n=1 Tax=Streptomyces sp. NPDC058142 TaxID=3346355 RepID=UPI0036E2D6F5
MPQQVMCLVALAGDEVVVWRPLPFDFVRLSQQDSGKLDLGWLVAESGKHAGGGDGEAAIAGASPVGQGPQHIQVVQDVARLRGLGEDLSGGPGRVGPQPVEPGVRVLADQ